MKKISMIIPCYNDALVLMKVYKELSKALKSLPASYEFIFIDNGSRDSTLALLRHIAEDDYNCNFLSLSHNVNKIEAVFIGAKLSTGEYIGFMDCSHPSSLLPSFFHSLDNPNVFFVGGEVVNDTHKKSRNKQAYFKMACSSIFKDTFAQDNMHMFHDRFYQHKQIQWIPYKELEHVESPWETRFIGFQKYTFHHTLLTPILLVISFIIIPMVINIFYTIHILICYLLSCLIIIVSYVLIRKKRRSSFPHGKENIKESTFETTLF